MSGAGRRTGAGVAVEAFAYAPLPEPPDGAGWELPCLDPQGNPAGSAPSRDGASPAGESAARQDYELRLAEETCRSFEAGREHGRRESHDQERAGHAAAELHRAGQLTRLVEDFAADRDRYLHAVELEVVRLALAVAARILRREAQMDPLLLLGAVRVAFGQLAAATEVRLHVPEADVELWKEAVALIPNPPVKPTVLAGAGMRLGDCRLETGLGSVDLALGVQLGEIERTFFDRGPAAPDLPALAEQLP